MTSSGVFEKTNEFIASVKALETEFENFLSDEEVGDDDEKLFECQNQFWNDNVSRVIDEMTENEPDGDIHVDRCILLWNNCFFTRFYNEKIFGDWSDLGLRKLTILLAIHNLEKFAKCRAIEIGAKTSDEESRSGMDNWKSPPREISNPRKDIEPTEAGDSNGEYDESDDEIEVIIYVD